MKVIPVILCGGSGTRLWPSSREDYPKQFLNLMDDFSLLQNTLLRALRVAHVPASQLVTVTLGTLCTGVERQLRAIDRAAADHVLREPMARNTAAAVAFAAAYVERTFGQDTLMWILPADHHIGDENAMAQAFAHAKRAAESGSLVTFGITPTRPETGYGYIRTGGSVDGHIYQAEAFVEKPNVATAQSYIDSGSYLWNSGMFMFSTAALLREYREHAPNTLKQVGIAIAEAGDVREAAAHHYSSVESQPFDKAIMEKSSRVAVVPCDPAWSDIGSWQSLWELRTKDRNGNVIDGRAACVDARNNLIQSTKKDRIIAIAGLENIVVVETDDALLIADRANGDAMKSLVQSLKASSAPEISASPVKTSPRPWTMVKTLPSDTGYTVREISLQPGESLHFGAHEETLRFWTVVEGQGRVLLGGDMRDTRQRETVFIPNGEIHGMTNSSNALLKFVEITQGAAGVIRVAGAAREAA